MPDPGCVARLAEPRLAEALEDAPVVLLHGPRQSGKSTLVRAVGEAHGRTYLSFDDDVVHAAASSDPVGIVLDLPARVTLDEIQRVPQRFTTFKAAVDRDRTPAGDVDRRLTGGWAVGCTQRLGPKLAERIVAGGYPPALGRPSRRRRAAWSREYVRAITQRDVRDLARIGALEALPRLVASVASQTARLVNVSGFAAPFEVSRPTIRDDLTLLQHVLMVTALPAWHRNRLRRLVKAPKLHMGTPVWRRPCSGSERTTWWPTVTSTGSCWRISWSRSSFARRRGMRTTFASITSAIAMATRSTSSSSAPFGERLYAVQVRDLWEPV